MRIVRYVVVLAVAVAVVGAMVGISLLHLASRTPLDQDTAQPAARRTVVQTAALDPLLPQVVQQGPTPRSATGARIAGTATFHPARAGRTVLVQKRVGTAPWRTHSVRHEDSHGRVVFAGPRARHGHPYRYRVVATRTRTLRQVATAPQTADGWRQTFVDNFSGTSLDPARWEYRGSEYSYESKRKCSKGDPRAVRVADGTLQLRVMRDPARVGERCHTTSDGPSGGDRLNLPYYLNGHVYSPQVRWRYGVAAARIKFPKGTGQHGSFWMQAWSSEARRGAEIDAVEYFGAGRKDGGLAHFVYPQSTGAKVGGIVPATTRRLKGSDDWWKSYHVFSVQWTPHRYVFRVDGVVSWSTKRAASSEPVYVILSELGSDWELPRFQPSASPKAMQVDWVRFWKRG